MYEINIISDVVVIKVLNQVVVKFDIIYIVMVNFIGLFLVNLKLLICSVFDFYDMFLLIFGLYCLCV